MATLCKPDSETLGRQRQDSWRDEIQVSFDLRNKPISKHEFNPEPCARRVPHMNRLGVPWVPENALARLRHARFHPGSLRHRDGRLAQVAADFVVLRSF